MYGEKDEKFVGNVFGGNRRGGDAAFHASNIPQPAPEWLAVIIVFSRSSRPDGKGSKGTRYGDPSHNGSEADVYYGKSRGHRQSFESALGR